MDEMDIVRKITHLVYTHRRDAAFTGQKQPNVKHRDIMMLDAIIKMGDLVKMSDISAYFQITPAAVSQCIKNFEKKGWVERTVLESDVEVCMFVSVMKQSRWCRKWKSI